MSGTVSRTGEPTVKLADCAPVAVGANRRVKVQDAPAFSVATLAHEPPVRVNSAALVPVTALVNTTPVVPPFVMVTLFDVFCPTFRLPKLTIAGDAVSGVTPTPVSAAEANAGDPNESVAVAVPSVVGANCTVSVQEAPAANVASGAHEPPVRVKAAALVPPMPVENGVLAVPELVMVSVAVAFCPTLTLPKLSIAGEIATAGAPATPVPVRAAVAVPPPKLRPAVNVPVVVGANCTMAVQLAPAASVARGPQLPPVNENCDAFAPVTPSENGVEPVPLFTTLNVALVVWPTTTLPKFCIAGEIATEGAAATPTPEAGTVNVPLAVVTLSVAEAIPATVGMNWSVKKHWAPAGSGFSVVQVPPTSWMLNWLALGPVSDVENATELDPVFCRMMF